MSGLSGRIDRLESRMGVGRRPLVICFGDPRREPDGREVCAGASGEPQEIPEGAQVVVFRLRPDGPQ
jgi:hypothetical protein